MTRLPIVEPGPKLTDGLALRGDIGVTHGGATDTPPPPSAAASQPPRAACAPRWCRRPVPRWLSPVLSWLGVALVLCLLWRALGFFYHPAYFYGIDESGYLVPAKGLALRGDPAKHTLDSPLEFVGENMVEARPGVFYGKYPIGYPLLCAIAYRLGGPSAPFLVNPAMALLGVVGMYLLGQALFGRLAGFLAAFLLGLHPIYLYYGLRPMSHAAATCCGIWGMYFLCRWLKERRLPSAFLAGAVTAYAGTIRNAEVLLLLAPLTLAAWAIIESRRAAARGGDAAATSRAMGEAGTLGAGIATGLAPLLLYQWLAFGAPWITGYSFCDESGAFSWTWFRAHFLPSLRCLFQPTYGLGYLMPLGFFGIGWLLLRRPKHGWLLFLWGVPLLVVYLAYYCGLPVAGGLDGLNQILYVRFFLTLYPAFILGALALADALPKLRGATTVIVTFAMLVFPLFHLRNTAVCQWPKNGWASHGREIVARAQAQPMYRWLQMGKSGSQQAAAVGAMVRAHAPDGAVLIADYWFAYFIDYVGDYHLYYPSYFLNNNYWDFNWLERQLASLHKPAPYPLQRDRVEKLEAVLGGKSEPERLAILAESLRRHLAQGRPLFLVTERQNTRSWSARLGDAFRIEPLAGLPDSPWALFRIQAPAPAPGDLTIEFTAAAGVLATSGTRASPSGSATCRWKTCWRLLRKRRSSGGMPGKGKKEFK